MKERPIIFNGPMVRALLDGSKTQTRRVVKGAEKWPPKTVRATMLESRGTAMAVDARRCTSGPEIKCPYGQPGDQLWVRESFDIIEGQTPGYLIGVDYRASHPECSPTVTGTAERFQAGRDTWQWRMKDIHGMRKWKPSIHMPRRASRITLEVTGVRVERLQDISESEAQAEGILTAGTPGVAGRQFWRDYRLSGDGSSCVPTAIESYHTLWGSINSPGSWGANPWVWVVEFKREEVPAC